MKNLFRPAKRKRVFEHIVDQIKAAILSGKLQNGQKLPDETALSKSFNTSRRTVREALRLLEGKGLIQIKTGPGGGFYVCFDPLARLSENFELLTRFHKVSIRDLVRLRERLEGDAAEMAARRAGQGDIDEMENELEKAGLFCSKGGKGVKQLIEADKALHMHLARISGNPLIACSLSAIYNLDDYFAQFTRIEPDMMTENLHDMANIVMAVANHNPDAARRISIRHIQKFDHYICD